MGSPADEAFGILWVRQPTHMLLLRLEKGQDRAFKTTLLTLHSLTPSALGGGLLS